MTLPVPRVLAVDDRYENLVAVENVLGGMNLEIVKANSGEEALAQVMRSRFALVLLDVQMPGMDGFETATLLRSHQSSRTIPIIFVTAISKDDDYAFRGYETGAVDFLFKPIDPTILRGKVSVFLDLFQQQITLEHEIKHRRQIEDELRAARTAAESANRAKSEFLANMSHELRTPMNSIIGFTRRAIKRADPSTDQQCVDALEIVDRNAHQLLSLINDILDMSKIESGRIDLHKTQFEAVAEIETVVQQLEALTDNQPISLISEFPDGEILVHADKTKFGQICRNLISNAIKYTDEGTVTIRVSRVAATSDDSGELGDGPADGTAQFAGRQQSAEPEHGRNRQCLRIEVEDTGIGIKETDRVRLFDRFSQLDSATTRRAGGTGLGLYITATYVRLHHGTIDVEGEFGKGSRFTVELPVCLDADFENASSLLEATPGQLH